MWTGSTILREHKWLLDAAFGGLILCVTWVIFQCIYALEAAAELEVLFFCLFAFINVN